MRPKALVGSLDGILTLEVKASGRVIFQRMRPCLFCLDLIPHTSTVE